MKNYWQVLRPSWVIMWRVYHNRVLNIVYAQSRALQMTMSSERGPARAEQIQDTFIRHRWERNHFRVDRKSTHTHLPVQIKDQRLFFLLSFFPGYICLFWFSVSSPLSEFNTLIYSEWCQEKPMGQSVWGRHVHWLHNFPCKVSLEFLEDSSSVWAIAMVHSPSYRARGQNQERVVSVHTTFTQTLV